MLVPVAEVLLDELLLGELLADALLEAVAGLLLELLLELLQAVTRIAVTARLAAATGTRLIWMGFITLLYG
jgi:hypothetical protein